MTKEKDVWYHCGQCGSLFQSNFGFNDNRVCEVCEKDPSAGLWSEPDINSIDSAAKLAGNKKQLDKAGNDGRRKVRKKRRNNVMMRVVIIWILLMLGVVGLRQYWSRSEAEKQRQEAISSKMDLLDEKLAILNKALPECHRALAGFLTSGTPEARTQFIAKSAETAGKMAMFYQRNPFPSVDVGSLHRIAGEVIRVGDQWMISTRWKETIEDGAEFDAVFQWESDTWKLDWLHFSRYSEFPWASFLAGEGPDVAEFRLLARKHLQDDGEEGKGTRVAFVMLPPEWGRSTELGIESPQFLLDRGGDEGLLLGATFRAKTDNEFLFGGSLSSMEPEGIVRVRVEVKREEIGGVRRFEIKSLPACHWIDSEVPGFDLDVLRDDFFGVN